MKKIVNLLFLVLGFLLCKGDIIEAQSLDNLVYEVESGSDFRVFESEMYISPSETSKTYSFDYKNGASTGKFNRGVYYLEINTTLKNTYEYRKIMVISDSGISELDVNINKYKISQYLECDSEFYFRLESKVSNTDVYSDKYYNFKLTKIDSSEQIFLSDKLGRSSLVNNSLPGIELDLSESLDYAFSITDQEEDTYFKGGSYSLSFNFFSPECLELSKQNIKIVSSSKVKNLLTDYSKNSYYKYNFSSDENFYLLIEGEGSGCDINPIIGFSNIRLQNLATKDIFITKLLSGNLFKVNNVNKSISVNPNSDKLYQIEVSNGMIGKKFAKGDYKLSFEFTLNSCFDRCSNYNYQKIILSSEEGVVEHSVSYISGNYFEFEFTSDNDFTLILENKLNIVRNDTYPLDSFYKVSLNNRIDDIIEPMFFNYSGVYISDVDNPISIETIKQSITAIDETDGDLSHLIIVHEDHYSDNKNNLGMYEVTFSVSDFSGNEARITILVSVVDITPPLIDGINHLECSILEGCFYNDVIINIDNIDLLFEISDNVDTEFTYLIVSDNWSEATPNINNTYELIINTRDSSSNISNNFTIKISYYDDIKPLIIEGDKIYTSNSKLLSIDEIKSNIIISNNFDGTNVISNEKALNYFTLLNDEYSDNYNKVGMYQVSFTYEEVEFSIIIEVKDDLPPVFYLDEKIIHVDTYIELTQEQIINLLNNLYLLSYTPLKYNFVLDEYTPNSNTEGSYNLIINVGYENNKSEIVELTIVTHDRLSSEELEIEKNPQNLLLRVWNSIVNFFKKIINMFVNFFKNIF